MLSFLIAYVSDEADTRKVAFQALAADVTCHCKPLFTSTSILCFDALYIGFSI